MLDTLYDSCDRFNDSLYCSGGHWHAQLHVEPGGGGAVHVGAHRGQRGGHQVNVRLCYLTAIEVFGARVGASGLMIKD